MKIDTKKIQKIQVLSSAKVIKIQKLENTFFNDKSMKKKKVKPDLSIEGQSFFLLIPI